MVKRVREAACEALPSLVAGENTIVPVNIPVDKTETQSLNQESKSDIILPFGDLILELSNNASVALIENTLRALQNVRCYLKSRENIHCLWIYRHEKINRRAFCHRAAELSTEPIPKQFVSFLWLYLVE